MNTTSERETSSMTWGDESTLLKGKGDVEDVSRELDNGAKDCPSWMKRPEFCCSRRVRHLIKPVHDHHKDDNMAIHELGPVQSWFDKHEDEVKHLPSPTLSPDLNISEL
ncbi:hypothetical protein TNCV_895411 [Trichonephila clavipes]|nr:hypothetical protein TNCV_895411 [Trichonephila clavipes]